MNQIFKINIQLLFRKTKLCCVPLAFSTVVVVGRYAPKDGGEGGDGVDQNEFNDSSQRKEQNNTPSHHGDAAEKHVE